MGIPMAKNILAKWGDLSVWNRHFDRYSEFESLGAKVYKNKTEFAASLDILITMVTAGKDVDELLFGPDGAIVWLQPGSIVIDMSTIGVEWAEKIGNKLSERHIRFLDAPVTWSTPKAITGDLTIFIGGEKETFEQAKSVLSMMGTNLQYMWSIGRGQAMKLVNNSLVAYSMIGLAEVMKLGGAMWLERSRLVEVIQTLPVSSPYTAMKVQNFTRDDYPMMFSLANMSKDITLAHDEMEKYGLSLDMLTLAHDKYLQWVEEGFGDLDVSAIGKIS